MNISLGIRDRWGCDDSTSAMTSAAGEIERADGTNDADSELQNLVPAPRSFFMDVKCPGCFTITTVFSHANSVVVCQGESSGALCARRNGNPDATGSVSTEPPLTPARRMLAGALPADGRQGAVDGGLLVPAEIDGAARTIWLR